MNKYENRDRLIADIAREELTQNCMFFASGEYKTCPRENSTCQMKRTCELLMEVKPNG